MVGSRRIILLFLAMAVILITGAVVSHEMGRIVLTAIEEVQRRHRWSTRLAEVQALVRDAESGQRGFLITGRENYLEPYNDAVRSVRPTLAEIETEVSRSPEFAAGIGRLMALVDRKMDELAATITVRRTAGFDEAVKILSTDQGVRTMHALQVEAEALNKLDESELAAAQLRVHETTILRNSVLIIVSAIELTFLFGVYRRIVGDRNRREVAAVEIQRQRELLSVTLKSIGDAVIVTDVNELITFVNPIAESLLLTPAANAIGRPCGEVFRIIDGQTREPVESPVRKVIETGQTVGLVNHTLLVRPDGSELPIDDAGSPVRDAGGALRGVVLIFRDFSVHRENAARMLAANAELAAANRAKDQFTAMLSHELRTPLTPVLGTLMAWEQNADLPAQFAEDLKMLRWNVELEARLIDDLLEMTRISTGKLSFNREKVDCHEVMTAVTRMYERELKSKAINLQIDLSADCFHALADNARLHQVFWNILKNAVKFTPKNGTVKIRSWNEETFLKIEFRDNGIGMAPETLGRIFRPLEQGSAEITRRFGGLGLGLAISKSLLEAQSGTLVAASDGIGSGSSFTVTLPGVGAPPAVAAQKQVDHRPARRLEILLIEDHLDTATVIRLLLQRSGHTVDVGHSVADGITKFGEKHFDLLLSDLGLPDGTGLDLIRAVRQTSNLPAIALTGYGMEDDISRCVDAGFNRHLTKPVNVNQLIVVIKELIPE